ncbi:hypothetical protein J2741_000418 [Methanolinea mesophila]|uniref:DUF5804 family protein n=1 Tax=Methanolinea mesophila TaxID=547055 RepID=UPI001AE7C80A|nr:DUF5804 family protein [Methanolinea mesophila]MBP1927871.1 hypothetical protein [Methanolinea mesophila]
MRILLLQKEGVDLYSALLLSETSRRALRFYHPEKVPVGMIVRISTLGSALSLVADLRWYVRRYMREVFFEVSPGIYCTHALAQQVYYDRSVILQPPWPYRRCIGIRDCEVIEDRAMAAGEAMNPAPEGTDQGLEVWCSAHEFETL